MSTKIYNGFRVIGAKTLDDAFYLINTPENRKAVADMVTASTLKYVANLVSRWIDQAHLFPDDATKVSQVKTPVYDAYHTLRKDQKEAKADQRRNPLVDFEFEISLIPVKQPDMIIGIPFVEQSEYQKWFFDLPYIDEFGYWDNTDQPEGITNEEWEERERIWEKAIGRSTPAEVGMTLSFTTDVWNTDRDVIRTFVPDVATRAKNHAKDSITDIQMKKILQEIDSEEERMKSYFIAFSRASSWVQKEGKSEVDRLAAMYEKMLPDFSTLKF